MIERLGCTRYRILCWTRLPIGRLLNQHSFGSAIPIIHPSKTLIITIFSGVFVLIYLPGNKL